MVYMFNKNNIVVFDVKTESFTTIALWGAFHPRDENDCNLVEVEGSLGVLESKMVNGEINFWIFRKGELEGWEMHVIVGFPSVHDNLLFSCQLYHDGKIIMVAGVNGDTRSYFCYDIARQSWRECEVHGFRQGDSIEGIYKCVESVFPVGKKIEARPINKLEQMLKYLGILPGLVCFLLLCYWNVSQMYQGKGSGNLVLLNSCLCACWFYFATKFFQSFDE